MKLPGTLAALLLAAPACGDPLAVPEPGEAPVITVEPLFDAGISMVPRVRVLPGLPASELSLFASELTDTQLARIRRNDVPATLSALEVPALAWLDARGETIVRPTRVLEPGAILTLVAASRGRLATLDVASLQAPLLTRRFPPPGAAVSRLSVLCGADVPAGAWSLALEPGSARALLEPDYGHWDGAPCVALRFDSPPGELSLLPPEVDGFVLEPEPYFADDAEETALSAAACPEGASSLGPLCAVPEDDRLVISGAEQPLLLRALFPARAELLLIPEFAEVTLRGFAPDSEHELFGEIITLKGYEETFDVVFRTAPARQRWVLNEVMANPLGPEPASEWVELVNAGSVRASLAGLVLADGGGSVELPDIQAAPGEFVVLARHDFDSGTGDVAPAGSAQLVRLPELAKNGLSNSGEPLRLVDPDGRTVSSFPALAARHAGVSLARKSVERAGDDPDGFAEHAAPGASPGAPNQF